MKRQKKEGLGKAERQRRRWNGRKIEKDLERQKDREGHGEAEKQKVLEWQKNREEHGQAEKQRRI